MQPQHALILLLAGAAVALSSYLYHFWRRARALQRQTHYLTLLNTISRKAISALDPEEMLTAIADEIRGKLPYDHIGIGLVDYATREVVIRAEAGRAGRGLNQRLKLGEGAIGEVVSSGRERLEDNLASAAERERCRTILPDAHAQLALPIAYADQMLGVLNVESRAAPAFPKQEVVLLRTLADQIGGALHGAYTFQKANEQAITDGLTGVKTHRFFMEALNAEWRRATRVSRNFSLLMLDLDKFKLVNDFYGHLEGDAVLQHTGRLLEQNCRRSDVIARYGGDEFVVLMPETNPEQAAMLSEKLRSCLADDPLLRERKITPSVGLATFPAHASTPQELIQISDASMYLAKHQGGNAVISADHYKLSEQKEWQRNVLEAYRGVTIRRLFTTGPEAFEEVYRRLQRMAETFGVATNPAGDLPQGLLETVTSLAFALDARDTSTLGHAQNVARYSVALGRQLGLPEPELEELRLAAILHDLGKIGIPEPLLQKSGRFDPEDFERAKEHAVLGAKILEPLRALSGIQRIVRHHHERVDGTGYPDGLKGEAIPFASRIIAIAEAFDAMLSGRSYTEVRTWQEALEELQRCAGTQFDPKLVAEFAALLAKEPNLAEPASREISAEAEG